MKRIIFPDRADEILYFPILTFGREDSDASRRFGTWGIQIYDQIRGDRNEYVSGFKNPDADSRNGGAGHGV